MLLKKGINSLIGSAYVCKTNESENILELVDTKHLFLYLEYFQPQETAVIIWRGNLELFAQITSELSTWVVTKTHQQQKTFL